MFICANCSFFLFFIHSELFIVQAENWHQVRGISKTLIVSSFLPFFVQLMQLTVLCEDICSPVKI